MKTLTVGELKSKFSDALKRVMAGEEIGISISQDIQGMGSDE